MQDNLVEDVPHSLQLKGQAISTYVDSSPLLLQKATGSPIHNVTIRRNTVINPKVRVWHRWAVREIQKVWGSILETV